MQNLRVLPKLRDSISYLYVKHAVIEQKDSAIEVIDKSGRTMVPVASLCVLLLGPGTSITHAAVRALADNGCSVVWVGEEGTKFYSQGVGETRKGYRLLHQARMVTIPDLHMDVVMRMYRKRFNQTINKDLTLSQLRGMEGVRMREAYSRASRQYGVKWNGRKYDRENWDKSDPLNKALSAANALLNGLCHAAIVSGGYSPGLGFIHTGKQLSFVYDIADLYKTEFTIPAAFEVVSQTITGVESIVRALLRQRFHEGKLLERILPDIDFLLSTPDDIDEVFPADDDQALPEPLWTNEIEV